MEYLLGSVITILIFFIARKTVVKMAGGDRISAIRYSQSHTFEMIRPLIDLSKIRRRLNSQASKHYEKKHVRVILAGGKAYWIVDNTFYEAEEIDGFIDKESAKPVDTMGLDKIQLDKMLSIVEMLTEGANDEGRNSGN